MQRFGVMERQQIYDLMEISKVLYGEKEIERIKEKLQREKRKAAEYLRTAI